MPLFEKVETLYLAHPFALKFITDSKTAIDEGRDQTPAKVEPASGLNPLWLVLGGVLALAALVVAGLIGMLVVRRLRARAAAPAFPGHPPFGTPGYGYPPQGVPTGRPPAGYHPGYQLPGGYPAPGPAHQQGRGHPAHAPYPDGRPPPHQPASEWAPPDAGPQTGTSPQASDRPEERPPAERSDQA